MLFYVYKKPINIDASLHAKVINDMQYASVFSLGLSFWQLTNPSIYRPFDKEDNDLFDDRIRQVSVPV
jgi:hypothetical protein